MSSRREPTIGIGRISPGSAAGWCTISRGRPPRPKHLRRPRGRLASRASPLASQDFWCTQCTRCTTKCTFAPPLMPTSCRKVERLVEQVMATNIALLARRQAAVPRGVAHATSIFAAKAENAEMWDVEGKRYVDFAGGIAVMNTGHRHPKVLAAIRKQLDNYLHTAFQVVPYEPYVALCEELNARAPFKGPAKTILFSTGSEAVATPLTYTSQAT